jgi:hypothetical protein
VPVPVKEKGDSQKKKRGKLLEEMKQLAFISSKKKKNSWVRIHFNGRPGGNTIQLLERVSAAKRAGHQAGPLGRPPANPFSPALPNFEKCVPPTPSGAGRFT